MWALVQKEFLSFKATRSIWVLLLLVPLIVIIVINMIGSNEDGWQLQSMNVAVVDERQLDDALESFAERHPEVDQAILTSANSLSLPDSLVDGFFQTDELAEMIHVQTYTRLNEVDVSNYALIISFPQDYREMVWERVFFDETTDARQPEIMVNVEVNEGATEVAEWVEQFIFYFQFHVAIGEDGAVEDYMPAGETSELEYESISMFEYSVVSFTVFFSLYVASTMANFAIRDKQNLTLDRMVVSNMTLVSFIGSRVLTGAMLTFGQLTVIFTIAGLFFEFKVASLPVFIFALSVFSLAIGGLSALIVALSLAYGTEQSISVISSFVFVAMGLLGGNFFDTAMIAPIFAQIGQFMPNGSGLTVLLQAKQGFAIQTMVASFVYLLLFGIVCTLIASALMRRKEQR
ncbi:ABC transporter permease [Geomicrobium sp. JSM 1781026]|uniref:ABC transporter permease n=1 Tax=Geomicrobium sp. JSM 1781026 TaxID=3344580 RepID=UPI0035C02E40